MERYRDYPLQQKLVAALIICIGAVSEFLRGGEYEKKGVSDQPDAGE